MLDLLLEGEDPKTKRQMNTGELRDNLLTFIVAGHETTALTLAWSMYLMGFDPEMQERARNEVREVLQGRACTGEDVDKLPLVRMIVDEALRLALTEPLTAIDWSEADELAALPPTGVPPVSAEVHH